MPNGPDPDTRAPARETAAEDVCPECGAAVPAKLLAAHLLQDHRLYEHRGQRRPLRDTLAAVLRELGEEPDAVAWSALKALAEAEQPARADAQLATWLGLALARLPSERRRDGVRKLARVVARRKRARRLLAALAADDDPSARRLALALAARLPPPPDAALVKPLLPLLGDPRLPTTAVLAAAAALLKTTGRDDAAAAPVLEALTAGLGRSKSVRRLQRLEKGVGTFPALAEFRRRLEEQVRMRCPRCLLQMRRGEMIEHLWNEHRLVLDGRRVREPWQVIDGWLDRYQREATAELLDSCRVLAARADPENGPSRLRRLLLSRGLGGPEVRRQVLEDVARRRASLCPHCAGAVPVPGEAPEPVNARGGRLSARGYRVEVSDRRLVPWLVVEGPGGAFYRGREPGRSWTRNGATLAAVGPFVLLALALAVGPFEAPLYPVAAALAASLAVYLTVLWRWRRPEAPLDRAVDHAWSMLAPRLNADAYSPNSSEFVAALALGSTGRGWPAARAATLETAVRRAEKAAGAWGGAAVHLAALQRLVIADAAWLGIDPVPRVADLAAKCFDGALPIAFAEALFRDWEGPFWTRGNLARLRALLCDRAFEAGFEVGTLLDAGRTAPALGAVLGTDDPDGLARLRLLWALRPNRPWDLCGPSVTVFDLAADAESARLLGRFPDLLLFQEHRGFAFGTGGEAEEGATADVAVGGGAVGFGGLLWREPPRAVEVVSRRLEREGGYEMTVDGHRFNFSVNPRPVADRLERWCRYYFGEFAPQVSGARSWRPPDLTVVWRAWGAVACPDCRRYVVPRPGEVAVPPAQLGDG